MTDRGQSLFSFAALAIAAGYAFCLLKVIFHVPKGLAPGIQIAALYFSLGLAVLGVLILGRVFFKKVRVDPPFFQIPERIGCLAHVLLFLLAVYILKGIDLSGDDFDRTGAMMGGYLLARVLLTVYFASACFGAGKVLLEKCFRLVIVEGKERFILYFFSGAASLALASLLAGFCGVLNLVFALVLMTPLVFYAAPLIHRPWAVLRGKAVELYRKDAVGFSAYFIFSWILFGAAIFLTVRQGLYPGAVDGDIWVHYIHYYREVIGAGSFTPRGLWTDFYLSKGASLFFLTGVLSDAFSAQLVSLCFILAVCVILFQLAGDLTKDSFKSLAAVTVFLLLYDGAFLKHHAVMTGCVVFLVWTAARVFSTEQPIKAYAVGGSLVAFYFGFYQAAPFGFLMFSFLLMTAVFFWMGAPRIKLFFLLGVCLAGSLGALTVMLINYFSTGLFYDVPVRFFWRIADVSRFMSVFGVSALSFFMQTNSDLKADTNFFNLDWAALYLRAKTLLPLFPLPFLGAGILFSVQRRPAAKNIPWLLAVCALFVLGSVVIGQAVRLDSLIRLYAFMVFFTVLLSFLITREESFPLPALWRKPSVIWDPRSRLSPSKNL